MPARVNSCPFSQLSCDNPAKPESLGRPAAVNQNVGAGDKARSVGAEKNCQRPNLLHLAPPAHWNLRSKLGVADGILNQNRIHLRCKRAGADGVDSDAV